MHRIIEYKVFSNLTDINDYEPVTLEVWPRSEIAQIAITGDSAAVFNLSIKGFLNPDSTEGLPIGQIDDKDYTKSSSISKIGGYKIDVSGYSKITVEVNSLTSEEGINCEIALIGG